MTTRVSCTGGLILIWAMLLPSVAGANPWTRDRGRGYVGLSYSTISAKQFYGPDAKRQTLGSRYSQQNVGLYGEVGVIDRWLTATIDANLYRRSSLSEQGYAHGVGDLRLGLWTGLLVAPVRIALGAQLGVPTGDPIPEADSPDSQLIANTLPTGDGEVDGELTLALGFAFGGQGGSWPLEHYALARLGYWLRTRPSEVAFGEAEDLSDALNWHVEIGTRLPWSVLDRFWMILKVFGSEPFARPLRSSFSGLGSVSHRSYAVQLTSRVWRGLGISLSLAGAFSARNLPSAPQYTGGISYEW